MLIRVLGPLTVVDEAGTEGTVPAGRQRVLLSALALRPNQIVPVDELVELIWDGHPPAGAERTVRVYVVRLRRVLAPSIATRIVTRAPGYLLDAEQGEVDAAEFERLSKAGGDALRHCDWSIASDLLSTALSLWRGAPLVDVPSDTLRGRELPRWEHMRLHALEGRVDADLYLGRQHTLVGELRAQIAEHPLREHLHGQLMQALMLCGDQVGALDVYRGVRDRLADELGIDPGSELRELHERILAGHAAPAGRPPDKPAPSVPHQLPPAVAHFIGRSEELATLSASLDDTPTVVISAIGGTAGVGKTALAVQWAHAVADRFPDGQLYVNLGGYDSAQPVTAAAALAGFLRALGVAGSEIPAEARERAALYRSLLAGRRMLVLADNAREVTQVRPLLPGTPGCAVLVTSRDALRGLVARDGARRVDLDLLPHSDAVRVLRTLIGPRADAEPDAVARLADQCARLPLALRVAAERAVTQPGTPLASLVADLADQRRRLDLLEAGGDADTAVRAVFSWSYRHLDEETARAFRLVGRHPGLDLDVHDCAALLACPATAAARLLDALGQAHLVHSDGRGRHTQHDLLRAYARDITGHDDDSAALPRLADHYLRTASAAMDILFPAERHRRPEVEAAAGDVVTDAPSAQTWLDAQRANLVAVAVAAPEHTMRLASVAYRYLDVGGHYHEATSLYGAARDVAVRAADRAGQAQAQSYLGTIDWRQGRYEQAAEQLRQALELFRAIGDRSGEARVLTNLGAIDWHQGRYEPAAAALWQAFELFRSTGDRSGEARVLGNLGLLDLQQAEYERAADRYTQAIAVFRDTDDRTGEAWALCNLAYTDAQLDHLTRAVEHLQIALTIFRETSDRSGEANALNELGEVLFTQGNVDQARAAHTEAIELAGQIGDQNQLAHAHDHLGRVHRALGDHDQASHHWQQALALFETIGAPEAARVRDQLAASR